MTRPPSTRLEAERAAVRVLAATCHTPVGIHAHDGTIRGFVGLPDGSAWVADELPGADGEELARRMLAAGAGEPARAGGGDGVSADDAGDADGRRRWHDRAPGRRRARRPGAADGPRGRADRRGRRRPLRPPDPAEALKHARADAELVYVGKQGGGPQMPQEEIDRLLVEHGRSGRRVVRLKGGDPLVFGRGGEEALVLREAGRRVRDRAGRDRRRRGAGLRGHPGHAPRARQRRRLRHRPRGPRQAGVAARLGRARALPGHARLLHGRARAAADRRAAAGRGPARGRARRGDRARHAAGPADARRHAGRRRRARRGRAHPRARGHRGRAGGGPARATWRGSSAARCTAAPSPSRAHAPRPARSPRGCASSGRR